MYRKSVKTAGGYSISTSSFSFPFHLIHCLTQLDGSSTPSQFGQEDRAPSPLKFPMKGYLSWRLLACSTQSKCNLKRLSLTAIPP